MFYLLVKTLGHMPFEFHGANLVIFCLLANFFSCFFKFSTETALSAGAKPWKRGVLTSPGGWLLCYTEVCILNTCIQ